MHIRKRLFGTPDRPRLAVRRSNRHMVATLVDDLSGTTLLTLSSTALPEAEAGGPGDGATKTDRAARLGEELARKALEKGIENVIFDRGGHPYHGRVRALAEKAREAGLRF